MKKLTLSDIPRYCPETIELGDGFTLKLTAEHDSDHGAPWEECDGHGPVSEWSQRDKRPGERVLCSDRHSKRFYDFAEAVRIAKRDGWDAPPYKTGTKGEQAVRAVEADFEYLQDWCENRWGYLVLGCALHDADGHEIASDYLGGVESCGDYWREELLGMANTLLEQHERELAEEHAAACRDIATV